MNIMGNVVCYLKIFAALHQVFHIINGRKEKVQDVEKLMLFFWQPRISKQLYHVAKIITTTGKKAEAVREQLQPSLKLLGI